MNLIRKIKSKEYSINFLFALLCTFFVFVIFIRQGLSQSDIVSFASSGDGDKQCFALFMKIRECIINGENFVGVDSGSWNGATEFFLRSNMPVAYVGIYIFAFLSVVMPAKGMYILFHATHMLMALYFMQKLCKKYFGLSNKFAMVVASLYLYLLCVGAWYLSYYIIISLIAVFFYFSLEFYYRKSIRTFLQLMLSVILALTSGYITVSVFLLLFIYTLSLIYIFSSGIPDRKISEVLKFSIPYISGGIITLPWLLQVFVYTKYIVSSGSTLSDSVFFDISLKDIFCLFSAFSFEYTKPIENVSMISFGLITCFVICFAIKDSTIHKLPNKDKILVFSCLFLCLLIIIWSCGASTSVAAWMYSMFPILGNMHLPNRYLMVVLPFVYIAIGLLVQKINWLRYKRSLTVISIILLNILVIYLFLSKLGVTINFVKENNFIIEVIMLMLFIWSIKCNCKDKKGFQILRVSSIIWIVSIVLSSTTHLYGAHDVYTPIEAIKSRSIIYDENAQKSIDDFINQTSTGSKNVYRIVGYDSKESVQTYLLANYEWYNYSAYNLCNYTGYEIQLCTPKDYRSHIPWFNSYDWRYLSNTRADYMMTDYETINAEREFFDKMIDWDKGVADIGNGRIMVKLFQFIPSTICKRENVYEDSNSLDNGYFYSHDLGNENIVYFDTNQNSYFEISVNAEKPSLLAFLPYANRHFHYYMDGVEVKPDINNMQAILSLESGNHVIRIVYDNIMGTIGFWAIMVSGILLITSILLLQMISGRKKRNEGKD